ncbi:MAG: thermonuclease family protein [Deltaproteobacteria bacterium]|nr:thermonuclease family protein [Deltaproteobacteria bacterium]
MRIWVRILIVFVLTLSSFSWTAVSFGEDRFVQVRWVDDGDTIVLSDGTRVRYVGINAPEVAHKNKPAEPFGPEAREVNRKLVYKKTVRLEFDREKHDQYGRVLAYVYLKDGKFVNGDLVSSGHAYFVFREPNTKHDSRLLALQREAMTKRVGLWATLSDQGGPFLGNRRSKRFHQMDCPFGNQTRSRNREIFTTKYNAFWKGYSPCKKCLR